MQAPRPTLCLISECPTSTRFPLYLFFLWGIFLKFMQTMAGAVAYIHYPTLSHSLIIHFNKNVGSPKDDPLQESGWRKGVYSLSKFESFFWYHLEQEKLICIEWPTASKAFQHGRIFIIEHWGIPWRTVVSRLCGLQRMTHCEPMTRNIHLTPPP